MELFQGQEASEFVSGLRCRASMRELQTKKWCLTPIFVSISVCGLERRAYSVCMQPSSGAVQHRFFIVDRTMAELSAARSLL